MKYVPFTLMIASIQYLLYSLFVLTPIEHDSVAFVKIIGFWTIEVVLLILSVGVANSSNTTNDPSKNLTNDK